ncbi:unnamed protein product [Candidula unifasciata]|uniref:SOCS box domain-containing protein n=1 Tax=Candidula unifasciata TaxID=100452 RepID=A0A8S3YTH6_9EUPU|nr:unnamed protein product [Candidula unifasciata]
MFRPFQSPEYLTNEEREDLALYDALLNNNLNEVRHLLQHTKRDLNDQFLIVRSKLHELSNPIRLVARFGTATMLKFLIEAGCDVNKRSEELKRSPIHMAVLNNNISCLQLLITAQAKLDSHDVFGNTPCHYAAELGYHNVLDIMIRIGIQVNSRDIAAKTPLMKAVRNNKTEAAIRLIRAHADINVTDVNNELALHFAVRNGNSELVDILLASSSCTDVQNIWGRTPLIEAVYCNNTEIVQQLLTAGCDIHKRIIKTQETALHLAKRKKYAQVVEKLLEYILASLGHTITMLATYDLDIQKYTSLLETDSRRVSLFLMAAERRHFPTCQLLAQLGYVNHSLRPLFQASLAQDHLSDVDRRSLISVLDIMSSTVSLKQTCRRVIRHSIGHTVYDKICMLPLPTVLRDYLMYRPEHSMFMPPISR